MKLSKGRVIRGSEGERERGDKGRGWGEGTAKWGVVMRTVEEEGGR